MDNSSDTKYNSFDYILLLFFAVILLIALFVPIKETISCKNGNCNVRDYSIVMTTNKSYDLSNITLEIEVNRTPRAGNISLSPISGCSYSGMGKAEDDMYRLNKGSDVVLKHASISDLAFLVIALLLFCGCLPNKKFTKYFILSLVIRLAYLLLI